MKFLKMHFISSFSMEMLTVYTRVQVEFFGRENGLDLYSGEHETYLPNHKKMPKFTATSQVMELSK